MAVQAGTSGHRHEHNDVKAKEWGRHNGGSGMDAVWSPSMPTLQQQQHQQRSRYEPPRVCTPTSEHCAPDSLRAGTHIIVGR